MYPNIHFSTVSNRTQMDPRCLSIDEQIKKIWYIYKTEYCSAIKRHKFESVELRQMNQEPTVQSEVIQKEKDRYCIYEIQKNGTDEPICGAGIEMQTQRQTCEDKWGSRGQGELREQH